MPNIDTIMTWLNDKKDNSFSENYARAKQSQADILAEEIIAIADDSANDYKIDEATGRKIIDQETANRSRLRIDARKWYAGKLRPKKYGDKLDVDMQGGLTIGIEKHIVEFHDYSKDSRGE